MKILSSKTVVFGRFFAADWRKGGLLIWSAARNRKPKEQSSTTLPCLLQITNPLWLTGHLLLYEATATGFLRWLFSMTDAPITFPGSVKIPHLGTWRFLKDAENFTCLSGKQTIRVPSLYRRRRGGGHRSRLLSSEAGEGLQSPNSYQLDEQLPLLIQAGRDGHQMVALASEIAHIQGTVEQWLLRSALFTYPYENENLTSSQRAAVWPFIPWEEFENERRGDALKKWKQSLWSIPPFRIGTQPGGSIRIFFGSQFMIPYHRRKQQVEITSLERYIDQSEPWRHRAEKRLSRAREYPLGWLFSSSSLLALVWAEILWCATNDIAATFCKGCHRLFATPSHSQFCSTGCWENFQIVEEGNRRALKALHQQLSRRAQQADRATDERKWISDYMGLWKRYEAERGDDRWQPKKVHPAMVALKMPGGRDRIARAREAKRAQDDYALHYEKQELFKWLESLGVRIPPEPWIDELLRG